MKHNPSPPQNSVSINHLRNLEQSKFKMKFLECVLKYIGSVTRLAPITPP